MAVQRGRSQVRDAKNNERHVCGRRRGGEPAVPEGESYTFHPPAPSLPRQALFPWPYVEVREATKKSPQVCARARDGERPVSSERRENKAGGLFQHPARTPSSRAN